MEIDEQALDAIYCAIDEINISYKGKFEIERTPQAVLFGENGKLDSLGLVNLIVMVEEKVEEKTGQTVSLADENAMSFENSPFRTVTTLKEYIVQLVQKSE
jgi:acyl carrier protein